MCREALRLTGLLLEHSLTADPETCALGALLSLHAARLPTRLDAEGEILPLVEQDRARWDQELVAQGLALLERSAAGTSVSAYHVEAAIAALHVSAPSLEETDWPAVVGLYDRLLALAPSPVVALNRAIALGQRDGPEAGLHALDAIEGRERLDRYPFYAAARGEMELRRGRAEAARAHFTAALEQARNPTERRFLEKRRAACDRT